MPDKNSLFDQFIDNVDKIGYFSHFFHQIKGSKFETELMKTNYSLVEVKFINALEKLIEIENTEEKASYFFDLISSISRTRLIEEKIGVILNAIDKLENSYVKRN